jgi:SPP1 family phage portal protein
MSRNEMELFPDCSEFIEEIENNGISANLIYKIIQKHLPNAMYNRKLYKRYIGLDGYVPIFNRQPKYEEEPINNKLNNDYFGLIVNAKVGCWGGRPISYSYSITEEAEDDTGGKEKIETAKRTLSDFVVRNNMHQVDIQTAQNAAIYGYSGRLAFIDKEGNERIKAIPGYETIILSDMDISEPEYAIRYYEEMDIDGVKHWVVDFYDDKYMTTYKGDLMSLEETGKKLHLFDYCPLQGVANNQECMGDVERVLPLIDDYNKVLSDNSNEIEAFVHAMLLVNLNTDDDVIKKAQKTGALIIPPVGSQQNAEPVKWLTKNINDGFTEHHLERLNDNIFTFSQTPNFLDEKFGNVSGVALEQKFNGMREKCTVFTANFNNSSFYMWKVLCSSWKKKGIDIDPMHIIMDSKLNIPQDLEGEARTVQTLIGAGLPKRYAYSKLSDVEDVEWIMNEIEAEKDEITEMYPDLMQLNEDNPQANHEG